MTQYIHRSDAVYLEVEIQSVVNMSGAPGLYSTPAMLVLHNTRPANKVYTMVFDVGVPKGTKEINSYDL